ncbi:hypothetical protein T260_13810 [Geobacillus thermopakistaniensis]|uniref:Uncharacterized protein n=1 Tax=Geobacillus thermopakistaniensis (strain MAS1) TaxID=1408282 RepID=A0A7U9J9N2_GEOTM|nr:hypothetical protein T260_13810 [Geobacillus sp. MAS1]
MFTSACKKGRTLFENRRERPAKHNGFEKLKGIK